MKLSNDKEKRIKRKLRGLVCKYCACRIDDLYGASCEAGLDIPNDYCHKKDIDDAYEYILFVLND